METIYLDDFTVDGIIKEKIFRKKIDEINWNQYLNKKVLIKGCSKAPVPTWAYLIIATKLTPYASSLFYGEPCSAMTIFKKN